MSYVSTNPELDLSGDYEHTWQAKDGTICSVVDLGNGAGITFDSADEARAVAARCAKAADAMDALAAEAAPAKGGTDG